MTAGQPSSCPHSCTHWHCSRGQDNTLRRSGRKGGCCCMDFNASNHTVLCHSIALVARVRCGSRCPLFWSSVPEPSRRNCRVWVRCCDRGMPRCYTPAKGTSEGGTQGDLTTRASPHSHRAGCKARAQRQVATCAHVSPSATSGSEASYTGSVAPPPPVLRAVV